LALLRASLEAGLNRSQQSRTCCMEDIKFKTRAKIDRARRIAVSLPEDRARPVLDLCVAHAAMAETNARLWKDNVALRKQLEEREQGL